MSQKDEMLTNEEVRQNLAECIPGFCLMLAKALGVGVPEMFDLLDRGQISKMDAIRALAIALVPDGTNIVAIGPDGRPGREVFRKGAQMPAGLFEPPC